MPKNRLLKQVCDYKHSNPSVLLFHHAPSISTFTLSHCLAIMFYASAFHFTSHLRPSGPTLTDHWQYPDIWSATISRERIYKKTQHSILICISSSPSVLPPDNRSPNQNAKLSFPWCRGFTQDTPRMSFYFPSVQQWWQVPTETPSMCSVSNNKSSLYLLTSFLDAIIEVCRDSLHLLIPAGPRKNQTADLKLSYRD